MSKDQGLKINIKDEVLNISIGTDTLIWALNYAPCVGFKITNKSVFLKEFVRYLKSEQEDGSTGLHELFDKTASDMMENGEEGMVSIYEEDEDE